MESIVQLMPSKWVSESVLMTITGMKKNTIKTAREVSWMEDREYKHVSPDGSPRDNSMCFYDWKAIRSVMQKDILNLRIELLNGSYFTGRKMNIEKKGRTAATVNSSMADLKAIFDFAHGNGYIEANAMTGIKPLKKSSKRPDPITREEAPRHIAACSTRQTANMWALAILTGLRYDEICALAWEDVDPEAKKLTVSRNLTPQGLFTPPKTEAGNRVICLIDAAVDILRDQRELTRTYPQTSFTFHT